MVKIPREGFSSPEAGIRSAKSKGGVIGNWGQCQRWTMEVAIGVRIPREKGQSASERYGDGGVLVHLENSRGACRLGAGSGVAAGRGVRTRGARPSLRSMRKVGSRLTERDGANRGRDWGGVRGSPGGSEVAVRHSSPRSLPALQPQNGRENPGTRA